MEMIKCEMDLERMETFGNKKDKSILDDRNFMYPTISIWLLSAPSICLLTLALSFSFSPTFSYSPPSVPFSQDKASC